MKGLPGLAVARPVTVLMAFTALLVVGAVAYQRIPVQLLPDGFDPPFLWVDVPALPAAPADHERTLAEPLEEAIATLPGLSRLETTIEDDNVSFLVELHPETSVDVAYDQLRDRLDRASVNLPEVSRHAYIWRHNPNEQPVLVLGVSFPPGEERPERVLRNRSEECRDESRTRPQRPTEPYLSTATEEARTKDGRRPAELLREQLLRAIERVPGVSQAQLYGLSEAKVRIQLDDGRLKAQGLSPTAVLERLWRENFTSGLGELETHGAVARARAVHRFQSLDEIRALPLNATTRLGEVATVTVAPDPEPELHRIDGQPAATVAVFKEATANTLEVTEQVNAQVARTLAESRALAGFSTQVFFDQGAYIESSIDQLRQSALVGAVIAVAFLLLFLRALSLTLLVTLAIPLCLLSTVIVLYFLGDTINLMSLTGLMLAVGMVVDNAIVVLENIDRLRREGLSPTEAAAAGAQEVALAVTLATLTTLVVFLPMVLLQSQPALAFFLGKVGFPVCYALLASLVVALVFIPTASVRLKLGRAPRRKATLSPGLYPKLLAWCLRHRLMSALLGLGLLASTALPADRIKRVDKVEGSLDSIRIKVKGPPNVRFVDLDETVRQVEAALLPHKAALGIKAILTRRHWTPDQARLQAYFSPDQAQDRQALTAAIKAKLPTRPGFEIQVGGGDGGEAGLTLHLSGPNSERLAALAQEIARRARELPGVDEARVEDSESGRELRLHIDPERTARAGLTPQSVALAVDYTLRGRQLPDYTDGAQELALVVELRPEDRAELRQLEALTVGEGQDGAVALGTLVRPERGIGYGRMVRENRRTRVEVELLGDDTKLFEAVERALPSWDLPSGYQIDLGERFESRDQNESGGAFAVLLAIALVFFLMGVLFESFILPFSILLCIPLAFCGVAWTLYLTATPLDIMAIVGCIILVGVVVNNGIVLIDQVQRRRQEGTPRTEALVISGVQRVRPILMTALTTIGGLVPMAVGRSSLLGLEYAPLGRVVIGGMLTGTLLTLFGVPLLYTLLDDLSFLPRRVRLLGQALKRAR